MSEFDRQKWNTRYRKGEYEARTYATDLLEDWLPRLPRGKALDVACGAGRNSLRLAEAGFAVDGVDIAVAALERAARSARERGVTVNWVESDLDTDPLPGDSYHLVMVARYLNRSIIPRLKDVLAEGGYVVYEQHYVSDRPVGGPTSAHFRLRPNELLHLFYGLRVLHYREGVRDDPDGRTMAIAELVARKGWSDN